MEKMKDLLKRCNMSKDAINFVVSDGDISERRFHDIVCGAPVSLSEKLEIINDYLELYPEANSLGEAYNEIVYAKAALEDEDSFKNGISMLYLFDEWYDIDVFVEKSSPSGMFNSLDQALMYMLKENLWELDEYENEEQREEEWYNSWYRMELWKKNDKGIMENIYEYFFFGEQKICWFNKNKAESQDNGNVCYFPERINSFSSSILELNFSTYYSTGDIVKIDCRPFGPPFYALILEDFDQFDCCFPTIVFNVPYTNMWRCSSLKHGTFYKDADSSFYMPLLSPLYRIQRVDPNDLFGFKYDNLLELKSLLADDPEKAKLIWKDIHSEDMTYDRLKEMIIACL